MRRLAFAALLAGCAHGQVIVVPEAPARGEEVALIAVKSGGVSCTVCGRFGAAVCCQVAQPMGNEPECRLARVSRGGLVQCLDPLNEAPQP